MLVSGVAANDSPAGVRGSSVVGAMMGVAIGTVFCVVVGAVQLTSTIKKNPKKFMKNDRLDSECPFRNQPLLV